MSSKGFNLESEGPQNSPPAHPLSSGGEGTYKLDGIGAQNAATGKKSPEGRSNGPARGLDEPTAGNI